MKQKYRSLFAALLGAAAVTAARAELRAAWEFNAAEVSGANVSASGGSATNTTGTLIADAAATNGVLTLDGTGDYLQFGNQVTQLRALSAMTISAWVRPGITTGTRRIVEHEDNFYFWHESSKYRFTIHGATSAAISTNSLSAGTWQHVLAVYESGKPAKIYVNGLWEDDSNSNQSMMPNDSDVLSFGANRPSSGTPTTTAFFNGALDDVAVWNTVLPLHQIESLAGKGVGGYASRAVPLALESVTALKATGVRKDAATLNVRLGPTNFAPVEVWAYWGTSDGGTDAASWAHTNAFGTCVAGVASASLTGLTADTTYYYRFGSAVPGAADPNARIWSAETRSFTTWRYQPDEIGDLQLWLKADDGVYLDAGTTAVTNGSVVTQWNDWSGNGRAVSRLGTSNNVTYAYGALNEMPVVAFTDLNNGDYLRTAAYQVEDNDDLSVFVVSRAATQTLNGSAIHPLVGSGTPYYGQGCFGISTTRPNLGGAKSLGFFGRYYNAPAPYSAYIKTNDVPNFSDGKGHVIELRLTGASTGGVGTFTGFYDGTMKGSHNGMTSNPENGVVEIGGAAYAANARYAGSFGDILIYNRALTDKERNRVGWYLQTKYGLTGSFTNPYNLLLTNTPATDVLSTSATCQAELLDGDVPAAVTLYWGTSDGGTNAAVWAHTNLLGEVAALGPVSASLSGLTPGTVYYYRFFGTNVQGGAWAPDTVRFETQGAPILTTERPNTVGFTTATLQATLTATCGAPARVWAFWGPADGGTASNAWEQVLDLGYREVGPLSTSVTGLDSGTVYHVRFYAENVFGATWTQGSQTFTTARPANIQTDGLVLWLRADAGVTHSGGLVDTWQDQAVTLGGANDASGSGASRPLLAPAAVNGHAALLFDGTDDLLTVPDHDALDLGAGADKAWTVIAVYRRTATDGVQDIVSKTTAAGSAGADWRLWLNTGAPTAYWGTGASTDGGAWLSVAEPTTNTFHILVGKLRQTNETAGVKSVLIDGGTVTNDVSYAVKGASNADPVRIGNYANNGGALHGYVAEILVYNTELDEYQANKVGWYLQDKYGLSGAYTYPERGTLIRVR